MDIGYSVRGNFRLLKSFNDEDEKPHGGWRIWAFRLTQMVIIKLSLYLCILRSRIFMKMTNKFDKLWIVS